MVNSTFKSRRLINLYATRYFYTISITFLLFIIGYDIGLKTYLMEFLPFSTGELWFINSYLCLMMLHPFINKIFQLDAHNLKRLIIILAIIIIYISTIRGFMDTFLCCLVWFIYIYICRMVEKLCNK